ncbi:hypothetical protein E8E11_001591 [Didymella keratinophila]|nr:hypothetical protein E8E11_001591 [Didymella keratinophila]
MPFLQSLYRMLMFWRSQEGVQPQEVLDPAFSKFMFYQNLTPNESTSTFGRPSMESERA